MAAGFSKNLIILDNTDNSTLLGNPVIAELAAEVIPTRTRLTFSQAQNFMAGRSFWSATRTIRRGTFPAVHPSHGPISAERLLYAPPSAANLLQGPLSG